MKSRFEQKLTAKETKVIEANARHTEARWLQIRQRNEQIQTLQQKKPVEEKKQVTRKPVPAKIITPTAKVAGQQKVKIVNRAALLQNMLSR